MDEGVRDAVRSRGISRICHFTRAANLASIARLGAVVSHSGLVQRRADFVPNDYHRHDHHPGLTSVTIEYPNVKLLEKWRSTGADLWVVLCFEPAPLWRDGVLFAPTNAARGSGIM